jgi:tetratricopeptide (TPR) repeat protein
MTPRIFFSLFPYYIWVTIGLGALLLVLAETTHQAFFLINIGTFLIMYRASILIHEVGHLIAGKIAGGTPRYITLGFGKELTRFNLLGIQVIVNQDVIGGLASVSFDDRPANKIRYAFFMGGGVLAELLVALLLFAFFGFGFTDANGKYALHFMTSFILANLTGLFSLWPFKFKAKGAEMDSDGRALLNIIRAKRGTVYSTMDPDLLAQALELQKQKRYDEALVVYQKLQTQFPEANLIMAFGYIAMMKGRFDESLKSGLQLEKMLDKEVPVKHAGEVYNFLAWNHLLLNNLEKADHYSKAATLANNKLREIFSTRASVLIELGQVDEGIAVLKPDADFETVNKTTIAASIYLMLGYHLKGDFKLRDEHHAFLLQHYNTFDADEKVLFDRAVARLKT